MESETTDRPAESKWRKYVVILVVALAVLQAGFWGLESRQPTYGARTVESWLRQGASDFGRRDAIKALCKMPAKAVPIEIEALTRTDSPLAKWYQDFCPKLPSWLQKHLSRPVSALSVRLAAYEALCGNEHTGEYLPAILKLLKDKDPMVRGLTSNILNFKVREQDTFCIPTLIEALSDEQEGVRVGAAQLLGRFHAAAQAALPALSQALKDPSPYVRVTSAWALSLIDTNFVSQTVRELKAVMSKTDAQARVQAAWRLKDIDPGSQFEAMRLVVASLESRDRDVRHAAASVLPAFGALATNATAQLTDLASGDPDDMVRASARKALDEIAKQGADPATNPNDGENHLKPMGLR